MAATSEPSELGAGLVGCTFWSAAVPATANRPPIYGLFLYGKADIISMVAVKDEQIVGHILFSPITFEGDISAGGMATRSLAMQNDTKQTASNKPIAKLGAMGLAPMAVLPECQRQGIDSKLIEAGLDELNKRDCPLVIVLGYPEYYPKFGFAPAGRLGLKCQWPVPDEAFMALLLNPDLPTPIHAIAKYRPEFDLAM